MAELYSCYQFNSSTRGKDGLMPISMNMSLDRAILHFETCLIAQYALENYPEELLKKNTLSCRTDTTMKKYCMCGKRPDLFCEELSFRDESKDNDRGMSAGDFETVKKCSDILAFVEFYINRLTSLNDDLIKNNMTSARHLLAHFADFRKDSPKDFKDNPLIFNIEGKNDTYRAHQDICNVKSVIFDKFGHVNRSSPKVKKVFFHDELNTVGKGYYVGFGDLFEVIRDNSDVNLYVSLIGTLPEEIRELHESYWKDRDEQQLTSSRKLIPLDELVNFLSDLYEKMRDGTELGKKLRYVIDRDEMDFRYGTLSPLNPFIGHLRPRDEDFETSHSSTSRIYRFEPGYAKKVILFSRILHCIIMDSRIINEAKKRFELAFDPSTSLLRLMDPCIFDRNYPPVLIFDDGSKGHMDDYTAYLKGKGYKEEEGRFYRDNEVNTIGIDWPDTEGRSDNIWERNRERTPISLLYANDNDPDILNRVVTSESGNNQAIVVTDRDSVFEAERMISASGEGFENIQYMAVFGEREYMSVRYDFHNIVEVGVKDSESLHRIHRNGLEQRRLNAVESVMTAAERDRGLKGDGDLTDRLTVIEDTIPENADICDMLLSSFAEVVRGLQ